VRARVYVRVCVCECVSVNVYVHVCVCVCVCMFVAHNAFPASFVPRFGITFLQGRLLTPTVAIMHFIWPQDFYWFSPAPCPVAWWEFFFIVTLTVWFSMAVARIDPWLVAQVDLVASCRRQHSSTGEVSREKNKRKK
jgi:hypothetical protein